VPLENPDLCERMGIILLSRCQFFLRHSLLLFLRSCVHALRLGLEALRHQSACSAFCGGQGRGRSAIERGSGY